MTTVLAAPFATLDRARRRQGALLDSLGFAPVPLPSEVILRAPAMRVHAYPGDGSGPPTLLVPAPIKRAYIWDLEPARSVVRLLVEHGFRPHLLEWTDPGPDEHDLGLSDYGGGMLAAAARAVQARTGAPPVVLGHSLGGTFAALFAARHRDLVRALVLLEAPVRFGARAGVFAPVVAAAPDARWLAGALGNVPGSFVSAVSANAAPLTFHVHRHVDLVESVREHALPTHGRVQRWALDELSMPGRLFADVVEELYRRDRFLSGRLALDGHRVAPDGVTCPLLTVYDPASTIIPPASALGLDEKATGAERAVLRYGGDRGVALRHVGVLVGENAHAQLWPRILSWPRHVAG